MTLTDFYLRRHERPLFYVLTLAPAVVVVEGLFSLLHFLFSTPTLIRHLGGPVYWLCRKAAGYINICAARSQQCSVTRLVPRGPSGGRGEGVASLSRRSLAFSPAAQLRISSRRARALFPATSPGTVQSRRALKSLLSHLIKSLPGKKKKDSGWFFWELVLIMSFHDCRWLKSRGLKMSGNYK